MKIIGFTAKKQTGKTTAVKYLLKKYPHAYHVNFKDALIEELIQYCPELLTEIGRIYDNSPATYDGTPWTTERLFTEKPPLIRSLMRDWGTVFRRSEAPNYWIHKWVRKMAQIEKDTPDAMVFVDDVRFLNEAQAVKDLGGVLIRIESDRVITKDPHQSEAEMDEIAIDHLIVNKWKHVNELYRQLDIIMPAYDRP